MLAKLHELTEQRCGVAATDHPPSAGAYAACLDAAARLAAAASVMQGAGEKQPTPTPKLALTPKLAAGVCAASASASASVAALNGGAVADKIVSGDGHYAMLGAAVEQLCVKDKGQG